MQFRKTIASGLIGLTLLTALQGCARPAEAPPATPTAIAVDTRTAAPAELRLCPSRPEGFSADSWAVMPEAVRAVFIRVAQAFADNADRQERLIEWESGKPCLGGNAKAVEDDR